MGWGNTNLSPLTASFSAFKSSQSVPFHQEGVELGDNIGMLFSKHFSGLDGGQTEGKTL